MSEQPQQQPLKNLGSQLKSIRQQRRESVADAADAIEIDTQMLERIERGSERPTEDILTLLISHFGMPEDQADQLWELAGYDPPGTEDDHANSDHPHDESQVNRAAMLILAVDPRVVYSDGVNVTATSKGAIISFAQGAGTPQALTTARIGMSRDQAYVVLDILQKALKDSEPRQLPSSFDQTPES